MGVSAIRLIPIGVLTALSSRRALIVSDQDRWASLHHRAAPRSVRERIALFVELMTFLPEYRTVLCYRLGLPGKILSLFSPRPSTVTLTSDAIGEGFCLRHAVGTLVSAESIGRNCIIHQLVTIGYSADDALPTIGDDVTIYPGATIVGKVHLGDGCVVGANSLVVADVPPKATVVGVPARPVSWALA